jgi:hypothetical protein
MANWAQLIKSSGGTLRRMAEEMETLQLPEQLKGIFPTATGETIPVYHGSPHAFDEVNFTDNLRTGEGAMAFGPGGYTSGNRPLAKHYADTLSKGKFIQPRRPSGPLGDTFLTMQKALRLDPEAAIAYMQGKTFNKAETIGLTNPNRVMPTGEKAVYNYRPGDDLPVSTGNDVNIDAYREWLKEKGVTPEELRLRRMVPGNMDELLRIGDRLAGGPSPILGSKPAGTRVLRDGVGPFRNRMDLNPGEEWMGNDTSVVNNLRATAAAQAGVPGPMYKASLSNYSPGTGTGRVPIGDLGPLKNWDGKIIPGKPGQQMPSTDPKIYEMALHANPNLLLFQDYPLEAQTAIHGALSRLYDISGIKPLPMTAKGEELIKKLPNDARGMQMMNEAGIPASAFLRAGRRGDSSIPSAFNPDDYNFVIHNDDALKILDVKNKKKGGTV